MTGWGDFSLRSKRQEYVARNDKNMLLEMTRWDARNGYTLCRPEPPFFVIPRRMPRNLHLMTAKGSLGTCVSREDTVGNVAPSLFLSPRAQARGPSA